MKWNEKLIISIYQDNWFSSLAGVNVSHTPQTIHCLTPCSQSVIYWMHYWVYVSMGLWLRLLVYNWSVHFETISNVNRLQCCSQSKSQIVQLYCSDCVQLKILKHTWCRDKVDVCRLTSQLIFKWSNAEVFDFPTDLLHFFAEITWAVEELGYYMTFLTYRLQCNRFTTVKWL